MKELEAECQVVARSVVTYRFPAERRRFLKNQSSKSDAAHPTRKRIRSETIHTYPHETLYCLLLKVDHGTLLRG